jgi:hypothetical protein
LAQYLSQSCCGSAQAVNLAEQNLYSVFVNRQPVSFGMVGRRLSANDSDDAAGRAALGQRERAGAKLQRARAGEQIQCFHQFFCLALTSALSSGKRAGVREN